MKRLLVALLLLYAPNLLGATYWVGKSGSDANGCGTASGLSDPGASNRKLTVTSAVGCMSGGDTLKIGDGTYVEFVHAVIPSGSSGSPTIVKCENSKQCVIAPNDGSQYYGILIDGESTLRQYITVDGIDCNGAGINGECFLARGNGSHIRFINGICRNSHADNGTCLTMGTHGFNCDYCDVDSSTVQCFGNGTNQGHGIYLIGSHGTIQYNTVNGNCGNGGGYGIHLYTVGTGHTGNIIRKNIVKGNHSRPGILVADAFDHTYVYDNYLCDNDGGLEIQGDTQYVYNNSLANNLISSYSGIAIWANSGSGHFIRGNLAFGNTTNTVTIAGGVTGVTNTNNLIGSDPSWTSAATCDLTIPTGSAAKDGGPTIVDVPDDIRDKSRPQGSAYDYGAYEFDQGTGAGSITITDPVTGTTFRNPNAQVTIAWTSSGLTGNLNLWASFDNFVTQFAIATVAYNSSPYIWAANIPKQTTWKVCIEQDASGCAGTVKSISGAFTVYGSYLK